MTAPTITAAWLERQDACPEQIAAFRTAFGEATPVTHETLTQAAAAELGLEWLARRVLTASAWAEYERVTAPARAEYERVTAPAWAEYERVTALARAEYERVRAAAGVALLADPAHWREGWDA